MPHARHAVRRRPCSGDIGVGAVADACFQEVTQLVDLLFMLVLLMEVVAERERKSDSPCHGSHDRGRRPLKAAISKPAPMNAAMPAPLPTRKPAAEKLFSIAPLLSPWSGAASATPIELAAQRKSATEPRTADRRSPVATGATTAPDGVPASGA